MLHVSLERDKVTPLYSISKCSNSEHSRCLYSCRLVSETQCGAVGGTIDFFRYASDRNQEVEERKQVKQTYVSSIVLLLDMTLQPAMSISLFTISFIHPRISNTTYSMQEVQLSPLKRRLGRNSSILRIWLNASHQPLMDNLIRRPIARIARHSRSDSRSQGKEGSRSHLNGRSLCVIGVLVKQRTLMARQREATGHGFYTILFQLSCSQLLN